MNQSFNRGLWIRPLGIALIAIFISICVQFFQWTLAGVIRFHDQHAGLTWFLPTAWIFFWLTTRPQAWRTFQSTDQVLREVACPDQRISGWLAPLIYVRTLWSHLFGASVGREGTALQISGSIADGAARLFRWNHLDRQALFRASLAAGLASAYRAPWAAFIFALELGGSTSRQERGETLLAAWLSFATALLLLPGQILDIPEIDFTWNIFTQPGFWILIGGLSLMAGLYKTLFLLLNRITGHWTFPNRWLVAGCVGLGLFILWSSDPLQNLGTNLIEGAFGETLPAWIFVKKSVVTAVFVAGSWFGGDFTPNMAVGASGGSILAGLSGFTIPALGAAIGLFLPVAYSHRIFATCWVMTMEYFGWKVALVAAPAFIGAYFVLRLMEKFIYPSLHARKD